MSGKGLSTWEEFQTEMVERRDDLHNLLPSNVKVERFTSAAISAVKHKPELLKADPRSLFNALTKAAQDGLLPDGREAVINVYDTRVKRKKPGTHADEWITVPMAQYNPMTHGIRKRALEIADLIIDAAVVYKGDEFRREQGDDPKIVHIPADLDTDPGPMIGCYAIFKEKNGTILHREVMRRAEVMAVKEQSKAKDSLMWTTFETEAWRKSVIRRGSKTVPVSEAFERIVRRDDEHFDFSSDNASAAVIHTPASPALAPPPAPSDEEEQVNSLQGGAKVAETVPAKPGEKPARAARKPRNKAPAAEAVIDQTAHAGDHVGSELGLPPSAAEEEAADQEHNNWRMEQYAKIELCESDAELEAFRAGVLPRLKPDEVLAFKNAIAERAGQLFEERQK